MKRAVATLAVLLLLVGSAMAATSATFTDFNGNVTQDYERSGSGQLMIEGNGERLGQENTYSGSANRSFDFQNVQRNASVTFIGNTSTSTDQRTYSEDFSTLGNPDSSNNVTVNNGNLVLGTYTYTDTGVIEGFESGDLSEYSGDTGNFGISPGTYDRYFVYNGSHSLVLEHGNDRRSITRSTGAPERGDTFSTRVRLDTHSTTDIYFGRQDAQNTYRVQFGNYGSSSPIFRLYRQSGSFPGNKIADGGSSAYLQDRWYRVEVQWNDPTITVTVYDSSGTQVDSISVDDTTYDSGDFGFGTPGYGDGTTYVDYMEGPVQKAAINSQGHWQKTYQDNDIDSVDFSQPLARDGVEYYVGTNETSLTPVSDGGSVDTTGRDLTVRAELTRQSESPAFTDGFEAIVNEQIIHKTENPSADIDSDGIAEASHSGILDNGEQVTKSIDAQQNFSLQLSSDAGNVDWQYSTYDEGRVYIKSVRDGEQTVTLDTYFAEGETYTQSISFTSGEHVYGVQTGDESLTKNVSSLTLNYTLDDLETQNSTNRTSENIVIGDSCDGQKLYYTDVCVPQGIWFYGTRGLSIALPMAGLGGAYRKFS